MKRVKKNQYNKYNNPNCNNERDIHYFFSLFFFASTGLLLYSAYYIIFEVIIAGKL